MGNIFFSINGTRFPFANQNSVATRVERERKTSPSQYNKAQWRIALYQHKKGLTGEKEIPQRKEESTQSLHMVCHHAPRKAKFVRSASFLKTSPECLESVHRGEEGNFTVANEVKWRDGRRTNNCQISLPPGGGVNFGRMHSRVEIVCGRQVKNMEGFDPRDTHR